MKRHITEPLRILYKRFCTEEEMTSEHMEAMRDICHAYMVSTKVPNMKCVLVIESDGSVKQKVPYNEDEGAIIYLYDKESRIVWESIEGRHYTDSIPYETKRLFYEPRFLEHACTDSDQSRCHNAIKELYKSLNNTKYVILWTLTSKASSIT